MKNRQERVDKFVEVYNKNILILTHPSTQGETLDRVVHWLYHFGEPRRVSIEDRYPEEAHKFVNPFEMEKL